MAVDNTDPRPVLRKELARVFKDQRMIRAFEKIFDLIPPEFIDQQIQIDTLSLVAELGAAQANNAAAIAERVASALETLAQQPTAWMPYGDNPLALGVNLLGANGAAETFLRSDVVLKLDQSIAPVWTGEHWFTAVLGTTITNQGVNIGAGSAGGKARWVSSGAAVDSKVVEVVQNTAAWIIRLVKDDGTGAKVAIQVNRDTSGGVCAILGMDYGNATDKPRHTFNGVVRLQGYTVATLPAGTVGDTAYVTDALGPAYNVAVVGGGAITIKVFYNGAAWVCG